MILIKLKCLLAVCLLKVAVIVISTIGVLAKDGFREGYFNGSSHVRLTTPISLHNHIGLSFKSCIGGELFEQHSNGNIISLQVQSEGLLFYTKINRKQYEIKLPVRLLDNAWHVVNLIYRLGNLTLYAGGQQQVVANRTLSGELLNAFEVDKNSVLRVGNGFVGCILEGPSLVFHSSNFKSVNVLWGSCILQSVNCQRVESCSSDVCMSHGFCVPVNDQYECNCTPRYSGVNCEIDKGSSCNRLPCQNNGRCVEDPWGNYTCVCDASHSGMYCELQMGAVPCDVNPCHSNATCRVLLNSPNQKECVCPPGFKGTLCEINIDECQSNPCRNGGICMDGPNSFTCNCDRTGYTGVTCEININECEPINPCLNEGTCFDNYGGYTCQCPSGFGGHNCELNLNECNSEPCRNGGTCNDKIGTYECICLHGFTGKNCQTNINECDINPPPCAVNFDCIDGIGSYVCVCKPGFDDTPPTCTKNEMLVPCTTDKCFNNGTCLKDKDNVYCYCPPGFTGKTCEIDECFSSPCINGGTCYKELNGHVCVCPRDYFGDHCQFSPNPCPYSACLNNGVCYPKNEQEYYCECLPGFIGLHCEINVTECSGGICPEDHTVCPDGSKKNGTCSGGKNVKALVDPCASSPCNNGTCTPKEEGYTCTCHEGITGSNCENDINECNENRTICNFGICYNTFGGYQCYCRPGYAGNHCDIDVDECLSKPCLHDAICENNINSFSCICKPGYTGVDCGINIDECASNPCQNEGTCQDEVAGFTCFCSLGLTGEVCETNIDDCEPLPCENGGVCIDGINSYICNCTDTGYYGTNCENNIDDCISNPCINEAECIDLVKGYECKCHPGYQGSKCEIDINECESLPCHNGGTCLEHSNQTLYDLSNNVSLPEIFSNKFDYKLAVGYECVCVPGTVGINCEKDINECESNPCHFGSCKDEIGRYKCECEDGYEGEFCETEINECERYTPCVNGTCSDRKNDYYCDCIHGFGGKNCSVELIGCANNNCANNGTCLPYLENETEHKFNCSCPNGFRGKLCEKGTTMSLGRSSIVLINSTREEGYDVQFRFKTTLPNGVLVAGRGSTLYILELINGRLNLKSSLLNKWDGVFVGSDLNNSTWHKVFIAINASHLVLGANEEQTIYPITLLNEGNTSQTSFPTTNFGVVSSLGGLSTSTTFFIGCVEDVQVNGEWVIPQDIQVSSIVLEDVEVGCPRKEQCNPNPCQSGGHCTDLWSNFSCSCERPYLGHTCQYNLTAATFGHENITSSYVTVIVNETTHRAVRNTIDISMFIRTRQDKGLIFYLGTKPNTIPSNEETSIIAQLEGGELRVKIRFGENQESYSVGGVKLDNGYNHLIQVVRNSTLVQFRINNTEYFKNTIGTSDHLNVEVLYLGGMPEQFTLYGLNPEEVPHVSVISHSNLPRLKRQIELPPNSRIEIAPDSRMKVDPSKPRSAYVNFKGIIQDVQISGGSRSKWVVEFFPLNVTDLKVPAPFGEVSFDKARVLEGEISDDTCRSNPCLHNGSCNVTWNDYICKCPRGYKGKSCQEMEFCQLQDCPTGSECRNLEDGYECVANITLRGKKTDLLNYSLTGVSKQRGFDDVMLDSINLSYRTRKGGTILHVSDNKYYLSISVDKNEVTIIWKLDDTPGDIKQFSREIYGNWTSVYMKMKNGKLIGGFADVLDLDFTVNNFPVEAWRSLLQRGKVYVGGIDINFKYEDHFPVSINTVNIPPENFRVGYFKGCLGEIRIGSLLLPFFTPEYLYNENFTAKNYFALEAMPSKLPKETGCILCYDEDCMNGGTCLDYNTTYACECPVGYEEDDCSKDIDWCEGQGHCENGATCVDGIANFTCTCPLGYTGVRCEINIDECASNPCINGECIDQVGSFKCKCEESYSGERCENLRIITCADRPCKRGSSCTNAFNKVTGDNFTCTCLSGYVGKVCDTPFCLERKCEKGVCDTLNGVPTCVCKPGYEGQYCEKEINECMSSPCQNSGQCIDRENGFICHCTEGFEGIFCETDVDECQKFEHLCGEGVCNNTIGSYKCFCSPKDDQKMCGLNCNISDPCTENPCQNEGICNEKCTDIPLYECECTEGYAGTNCTELKLGESASPSDIALIVGPIVIFLLLAGAVGLSIFIMMARKKRATRGTYSPSQQEYCNPRVEMDNVLKPPPEERLI